MPKRKAKIALAQKVIDIHAIMQGQTADDRRDFVCLLVSLRHWAKSKKYDWGKALNDSLKIYNEENR